MAIEVASLFARFGPMVHRRCRRLLGSEAEAEDATQDVFVRVMMRKDELVEDRIGALLWTMATQVSLNRLRRRRRKPEDGPGLLEAIATAEDPEAHTLTRRVLDAVFAREPEDLVPSTRTLATLRWVDGMTLEEVAATTGLSVAGVRKRLATLQRRVRALAEEDLAPALAEAR